MAFLIHLHAKLQLAAGKLGEARQLMRGSGIVGSGGGSKGSVAPTTGGPVLVVAGPPRQAPTIAGRAGGTKVSKGGSSKGRKGSSGRRLGRSLELSDTDMEEEEALEAELTEEEQEQAAARPARATRKRSTVDLQVQQLSEMGYSADMARDALEECGGNVHAAAEWLLLNCAA